MKKLNYIIAILAVTILTITACGGDDTTIYKVTFDADDGRPVFTQNVVEGAWAIQPQIPTKTFTTTTAGLYRGASPVYTFVEWQHNGTAFNFDSPITGNITLTAHYSATGAIPTLVDTVAANDIVAAFDYVGPNASQGEFILFLNQNVTAGHSLMLGGGSKLTIIGIGEPRTIKHAGGDEWITFLICSSNGTSLTLGFNITLNGFSNARASLVSISNFASLTMLDGSKITGHSAYASPAVRVDESGNFIMKGGEITGNHSDSTDEPGGGVYILSSTFTMSGGSIIGNTRGNPREAIDIFLPDQESRDNSSKTGGTIGVSIPAEFKDGWP